MTDSIRVLGQILPAANTLTTLYTVPVGSTGTVSSSISINNQSTTLDYVWLTVAVGGAADSAKQYEIGAHSSMTGGGFEIANTDGPWVQTLGRTLAVGDVVRCKSLNGTSSFTLYGTETG